MGEIAQKRIDALDAVDRMPSDTFWRGKPISDCTKEELIDAVMWLGKKYEEFHDPKTIRARALGQIEMMKRGEPA